MGKAKWEVAVKCETREELYEMHEEDGEEPEDFDIKDFNSVEVSVLRSDNELGMKSYGWGGMDKIILFGEDEYKQKDIEWCKQVAETICNALNKEGL